MKHAQYVLSARYNESDSRDTPHPAEHVSKEKSKV